MSPQHDFIACNIIRRVYLVDQIYVSNLSLDGSIGLALGPPRNSSPAFAVLLHKQQNRWESQRLPKFVELEVGITNSYVHNFGALETKS